MSGHIPFLTKSLLLRGMAPAPRFLFHGLLLGLLLAAGCQRTSSSDRFQGYIEAEYVYVASPRGGRLERLHVQRGDQVEPTVPLFELDQEPEATIRREAVQGLKQAQAQLKNSRKGKRPSELAAIEAKRDQAKASLALAEQEAKRFEKLYRNEVVSIEKLDSAHATRDLYQAQVAELTADLETSRLGARPDEIEVAEAVVVAAEAKVSKAEWDLSEKSQTSPVQAIVHDTLYRPGEWVAAGNPVVVLLPPANLKVRFFVPQAQLSDMNTGTKVNVSFDGAPSAYTGYISYVSTRAEFTPPVIYSQQTRDKLVFMVEAKFEINDPSALRPGQPVDVTLVSGRP